MQILASGTTVGVNDRWWLSFRYLTFYSSGRKLYLQSWYSRGAALLKLTVFLNTVVSAYPLSDAQDRVSINATSWRQRPSTYTVLFYSAYSIFSFLNTRNIGRPSRQPQSLSPAVVYGLVCTPYFPTGEVKIGSRLPTPASTRGGTSTTLILRRALFSWLNRLELSRQCLTKVVP
jgi:hypothetical protein